MTTNGTTGTTGMLTREHLEDLIRKGDIDTVLMVFPDLQGRLVGKRTTGRFFLERIADGGTENCDYLIACDMDNEPVPGYRFTSYEQGYGDMLASADWDTIGESIKKTNNVLIVEQGAIGTGYGAWLADEIQRRYFDWLDQPVQRVTGSVASPSISKVLERAARANRRVQAWRQLQRSSVSDR